MKTRNPCKPQAWEQAEDADEQEMADMLRARGSDLSADGTYGDELVQLLGLSEIRVFLCHPVRISFVSGNWYHYALVPDGLALQLGIRDVIARSHAAAAAVLLVELLARTGREVPADIAAMASRVLAEGGATWS